ncbi:MAG: hypothetical protein PHR35_01970 [Kiritimatiellae bacterium]|nr:hypothetical protein [Kiritimatiellia bacterium]
MNPTRHIAVVVLSPDRVGLLRDITGIISASGGNIGGIRQAVVDGFFSLAFTATLDKPERPAGIAAALTGALGPEALVIVREFKRCPPPALEGGQRFVALTRGPDRPGTIHAISDFFVRHGVNIEEWQVDSDGANVVYVAEVTLPGGTDTRAVQQAFREEMLRRGLSATLAHENIFRATNEIGPIAALLKRD